MRTPLLPVKAFCSFADEDAPLLGQLKHYLYPLQREGYLSLWDKNEIVGGDKKQEEIDRHLNAASLIFLLISAHFLASDACDIEMRRALQQHETEKAVVIPVLLRPCGWRDAPFAHLQSLPAGTRPIVTWKNHDEAWATVVEGIRRILDKEFGIKGNITQEMPTINAPLAGQAGSRSAASAKFQQKPTLSVPLAAHRISKKGLLVFLLMAFFLATFFVGGYFFLNARSPLAPTSGPIYAVVHTHDIDPDGVYFRHSPHTQDFDRVTGFGVYWNDHIRVSCWSWGDAASQNGNKVWYYAYNINRPIVEGDGRSNQGWINSYYVADGMTANYPASGIPQCGNSISNHIDLTIVTA